MKDSVHAPAFSKALVHLAENDYDIAAQRVTGTIIMDERQNNECCMRASNRLCPNFLGRGKAENRWKSVALV